MTEQVCRECRRLVEGQVCPTCNSASLSRDWSGYVVIIDPKESIIAQKLEITLPGKYALKVR
ncbi:MAG TPA: transcription elongation factor subunit Spt4 [Methanothrix sp.]|jgi:DNA-directed RNA polymerase subunit E"|nr:transcription elongation factor subunit Spt4 [Methanothrix sp.]HPT19796.1 transcription elongation factor subunit Spt4 [Methanothrix sp.]